MLSSDIVTHCFKMAWLSRFKEYACMFSVSYFFNRNKKRYFCGVPQFETGTRVFQRNFTKKQLCIQNTTQCRNTRNATTDSSSDTDYASPDLVSSPVSFTLICYLCSLSVASSSVSRSVRGSETWKKVIVMSSRCRRNVSLVFRVHCVMIFGVYNLLQLRQKTCIPVSRFVPHQQTKINDHVATWKSKPHHFPTMRGISLSTEWSVVRLKSIKA